MNRFAMFCVVVLACLGLASCGSAREWSLNGLWDRVKPSGSVETLASWAKSGWEHLTGSSFLNDAGQEVVDTLSQWGARLKGGSGAATTDGHSVSIMPVDGKGGIAMEVPEGSIVTVTSGDAVYVYENGTIVELGSTTPFTFVISH